MVADTLNKVAFHNRELINSKDTLSKVTVDILRKGTLPQAIRLKDTGTVQHISNSRQEDMGSELEEVPL